MKRRRSKSPGVSFFAFQDIITAVVGIFILITLILVLELAERVEKATAGTADTEDIQPILATIELQKQEVQELREQYAERREKSLNLVGVNSFNRSEKIEELRNRVAATKLKQASLDQQVRELQNNLETASSEQKELKQTNEELEGQRQLARKLEEQLEQLKSQASRLTGDETEIYRDKVEDGRYLTLLTLSSRNITIRDAQSKTVTRLTGRDRVEDFRDWLGNISVRSKHFMMLVEPGGALDLVQIRELLELEGARYGYTVVEANHGVRLGFEIKAEAKQGVP